MTNDELLAGLLDNSLTETEHRELSARMAASPQFAEEVREYLAVEEALQKSRPALRPGVPSNLMDLVENSVAASVAAASGAAVVSDTAGRSILSNRIIGGLSLVLLSGAALWYFTSSGSEPTATQPAGNQTIVQQQQTPHTIAPQTPSAIAPQNTVANSEQPSVSASAPVQQQQEQPAAQEQTNTQTNNSAETPAANGSRSMDAKTQGQEGKARVELAKRMAEYEKSKADGDAIRTMLAASQVGIVQLTLRDFGSSKLYLNEALTLARQLKLAESEATITGQIGLLEKERGNRQEAVSLIEECVNKLRAIDSPELQRWQDELRTLQAK